MVKLILSVVGGVGVMIAFDQPFLWLFVSPVVVEVFSALIKKEERS